MKHKLFHKANYVLAFAGLGVGLFLYGIDFAVGAGILPISRGMMWSLFTAFFCFAGLIGGRVISILHHWAYRDFMTGVWNRKYFVAKLHCDVKQEKRCKRGLCLAFVDIDDFKKVNDHYGHEYGDEVIRMVANAMLEVVGTEDAVIRFGGDEFVIVFSERDIRQARTVAERIRRSIDEKKMHVTVSVGLVEINDTVHPAEVIRRLDHMLYRSKKTKNAVNVMVV